MTHEPYIRLGFFFGVLCFMSLWEVVASRRRLLASKPIRWFSNLGLVAINSLLVRVVLTFGAVGVSLVVAEQKWGLFHHVAWPDWWELLLAVVLFDLVIYLQHVMFHAVPAFWRFHMVHHADPDLDVTTGLRFHTIEIALSMGLKIVTIVVLGPSPLAVLVFEVLLNATSMFNHSNAKIPVGIDRYVRLFVVTPDMHRVHHSAIPHETNSNFGFNLPWWDWLLGTYLAHPSEGHERMAVGLAHMDVARAIWLPWMLVLPFANQDSRYPIRGERVDPVKLEPDNSSAPKQASKSDSGGLQ